jgi:hypothetical protein
MTEDDKISVEKYLSLWLIKHEQSVDERFASRDRHLELQAREYEHRLEILNHESDQLKTMQQTYVRKDLYDQYHNVLADHVHRLDLTITSFQDKVKSNDAQSWVTKLVIGTLVLALIGHIIQSAIK